MNTLDIKQLLPELKKQVTLLAEDLLKRVSADAKINDGLKEAFQQIEKGGRTAQAYEVWLEDYLDQVAVAWVLACVFVRFMEDNGLIDECWLAGEGERRNLAEDTLTLYFREHKKAEYWQYFQHVFHEVGKIPAAAELFAEGKTPLWAVAPSGDAAMNLLKFWREMNPEAGTLKRPFKVDNGDTRFLGDLYQELSQRAKDKYALLQTPVFVEEFILDRTLTPAIAEFGLEKVRMIDPTCGSGHFLLGAFARLFKLWSRPEHTNGNAEKDAQMALNGVWGVDINPFAVAIARFRLIVAAVQACDIGHLKEAHGWTVHLATGDSLLFGTRWSRSGAKIAEQKWLGDEESWAPEIYACDDKKAIAEILGQQYHAVVGNPPYITPKDSACRQAYRQKYLSAHDKYHLSTPFTERFFELACSSNNGTCGHVGLIKDNAFMRRVFGKKLVEDFLSNIDLTHVVNTEGAYIPGHGTPTVILFGRNRRPVGDTIRAVYGIKGEPGTPNDPSQGHVWKSIIKNIDKADSEDAYTSSADVSRTVFSKHPWSTSGGGASELFSAMQQRAKTTLSNKASSIGIVCFTLEDDVFVMPRHVASMWDIPAAQLRDMVEGDSVRDWMIGNNEVVLFPYDTRFKPIEETDSPLFRYLWKYRSRLANNKMFNGKPKIETGLKWFEYGRLTHHKLSTPLSIVFGEIATHNHFVLDRGGRMFNRTAPVIKMPQTATEDDHYGMLSVLNCSAAGFWLKQGAHNKGDSTDQHGARTTGDPAFNTFVFNSKHVEKLPLPSMFFPEDARKIDKLAQKVRLLMPISSLGDLPPSEEQLDQNQKEFDRIVQELVHLQEELDWKCYHAYGLIDEDLSYKGANSITLEPGQRAFEIILAQHIQAGDIESDWFRRHERTAFKDVPSCLPDDYRAVVRKRLDAIQRVKPVRLIERPEFKRRWQFEEWHKQVKEAIREWLLRRLTMDRYFPRKGAAEFRTLSQISDLAKADASFQDVAALYRKRTDFDTGELIKELIDSEAVPFLPSLVYKRDGFSKRGLWERAWQSQREEDSSGETLDIKYPKDFTADDFQSTTFYRQRGKLDVPKERWISYPHCSTDSDPTLVVGWAGWNHLEQATALVAYYDARKREGWDANRLTPLLAGLDQLLPWIHQWHPEIDPEFGDTAGQSFQHMLESDAHELGLTLDDIRKWTPPVKQTKASQKKAKGQTPQ